MNPELAVVGFIILVVLVFLGYYYLSQHINSLETENTYAKGYHEALKDCLDMASDGDGEEIYHKIEERLNQIEGKDK